MNAKKKRVGTKAQIRAMKEKERRIATVIFLVLMLLIVAFSACFTYSYLSQPQILTVNLADMFRAAIIDHLSLTFPNQTFIEKTTNILEQAGYTVDYYPGEKVTVDFYRQLLTEGYGLLILRVHSAAFDEDKESFLFTSQPYSQTQYINEQLTDQIKIATPQMTASQFFSGNIPKYFAIGPKFIRRISDTRLGNATIIAMGCDGIKYTVMAEVFIDRGAKVYISWNGPVSADHTDKATVLLLQHLITEKQTINQAVDKTMKEVGLDPVYNSSLAHYPREAR